MLSNAVKYGAGKPVSVKLEVEEERVRLAVHDQGIGIPAEDVSRIFGRFQRAASIHNYGGLGLGLYITRHIVEAHRGTIAVASSVGEGSTFSIDLLRFGLAPGSESQQDPGGPGVIDPGCEKIAEVLDGNYRPLRAPNGAAALDELRAAERAPCMILLDMMMPVMDGREFRAQQREDPSLREIPVVVLSAHADAASYAAQMDAEGYLRKPIDLRALLETVERFCARDG